LRRKRHARHPRDSHRIHADKADKRNNQDMSSAHSFFLTKPKRQFVTCPAPPYPSELGGSSFRCQGSGKTRLLAVPGFPDLCSL